MSSSGDFVAVAGVVTPQAREFGMIANGADRALRYWAAFAMKVGRRDVAAKITRASADLRFQLGELLKENG